LATLAEENDELEDRDEEELEYDEWDEDLEQD
jgi:hypothetical protein